jgi:iron complex outermembrane receptor protein
VIKHESVARAESSPRQVPEAAGGTGSARSILILVRCITLVLPTSPENTSPMYDKDVLMRHPRTRRAVAFTVLTCLPPLTLASAAWADAGSDRAGRPGLTGSVLEEVVVTARKRPEPLRDVPTSLTVMDADTLATLGAERLGDVERRLPNLATDASPLTGFGARYVRGLNAGARNIGFDSGYSVFVDGVYSGRYITADRVLQDVERIEYLPGPQGTLFGKNTTLGVLNIVTRPPEQTRSAELGVGFGSDGQRTARAAASTPLGETWAASAAIGQRQRDGLVEEQFLGTAGNNVDHWDARVALRGSVAGWQTTIAADYFENSPDLIARQRLEGLGALPPRVAGNDQRGRLRDEDYGVAITAERELHLGTLTAISGYRSYQTEADLDDDAWEIPVQHLIGWTESADQFSQELRLSGSRGAVDYLVGGYFLDMDAESTRGVTSFIGQAQADGEIEGRTYAVFGTVGRSFTERLSADVGLRWTLESKDMPVYSQDGGGVLIDFVTRDDRSVSSVTPSLSVSYAVSERATAFARYAQGFKSGGFNVDLVTAPAITPLEFDDERVDTVETGIKSAWLDNRLRLNIAAFRSEYRDLQVSQYQVLPGAMLPTLRITNAASAHTQGVELGAELMLARWLFAANVGQTHSEVDSFPDPLGPGTGNYAGNPLGGPEWTSSLLVQYGRGLGTWADLTFTAEHLFQDALGGDLSGDKLAMSDALSLVNLRTELAFGDRRQWRVRAWVDNVFDTDRVVERHRNAAPGLMMLLGYPAEIADSTVGLYNDPRTYGIQLNLTL